MRISDWSSDVCSSDLGAGDAFVQGQAGVHIGQVIVRNQRRNMQLDLRAMRMAGIEVGNLALLERAYCALQQLGIQREADFGDLPALLLRSEERRAGK